MKSELCWQFGQRRTFKGSHWVLQGMQLQRISQDLQQHGYVRDWKQCREKIKALKKKYKESVDPVFAVAAVIRR